MSTIKIPIFSGKGWAIHINNKIIKTEGSLLTRGVAGTLRILVILTICIFFFSCNIYGQQKNKIIYYPADSLTVVGKIMKTKHCYHRIDTILFANLPENVKLRLTQSAGLAISFKTNSSSIYAKWCTTGKVGSAYITPVAYRGLDLYIKKDGHWQFAGVGCPEEDKDCTTVKITDNMGKQERECLLYLPLYNETLNLSIGVEGTSMITPGTQPFRKRLLIYGSSITQGASASRPGMAYPALLSRATGLNFLNLGMGGSAKMEKEVTDMIAQIDADAYILDCVPNSSPNEIKQRTAYLINRIRETHQDAPIIVMQSVIRESGYFNLIMGDNVALQNKCIYDEVEKLQKKGLKGIYFIPATNFLGDDHEGSVDGTHPNDLGFDRMIRVLKPRLMEILNERSFERD